MGQKINPNSFRLGIVRNWPVRWFLKGGYAKFLEEDEAIRNTVNKKIALAGVAAIDLDLALIEGEINHPDLTVTDWLGDELVLFCGAGHPLAGAGPASIDSLLDENWIVREPGSGTRQTLDRAMTPYWARWKIALELEHTEAIKGMVAAGPYIGCVSRMALSESFATGGLVEIAAPTLDLHRHFYLVTNRQKYRTPGIGAFLALAQKFASDGGAVPAL